MCTLVAVVVLTTADKEKEDGEDGDRKGITTAARATRGKSGNWFGYLY